MALALVACLIAGGVGGYLLLITDQDDPISDATPQAPTLTADQARTLAERLADPDPTVVAPALADAVRAEYEAAPAPLLPPGGALAIHADTFTRGEADTATVQATISDAGSAPYVLALVYENSAWRVLMTVQR